MKKYIFYLLITILFFNCKSENEINNLNEIILSKNLKFSIDKFINFMKKNNPKDCILIQGNELKKGHTIYFFQNFRPYLLEGNTAFQKYHNEQHYKKKYIVFTYKGIDFIVSDVLKQKFSIKPQDTKEILDYFDFKKELPSKEEVDRTKTNKMMLKIDSGDKIIYEKMISN